MNSYFTEDEYRLVHLYLTIYQGLTTFYDHSTFDNRHITRLLKQW